MGCFSQGVTRSYVDFSCTSILPASKRYVLESCSQSPQTDSSLDGEQWLAIKVRKGSCVDRSCG